MFADSEALNLVFGKFQPSKFANNHQNLILEPQNCQNGYFSNFWNPKNRFHVKSEWQENPEISTLCKQSL